MKTKPTKKPKEVKQNPVEPKKPSGISDGKDSDHKTKDLKKEIRRKRSTIQKDVELSGGSCLKLGRPNLFETPEELLEIFNLYLASIQEKVTMKDKKITDTYDRHVPKTFKKYATKDLKGVVVDIELKEVWIFKEKPSKLKFYVFLGGMSSDTWTSYKKSEEFSEAVELIETYLESIVEDGAIAGEINPTIAQFVLNTTYGRVPKNINLDKEYIPTDDEKEKMDNLLGKNT